jgi:aerobic-type carbon monoxide dehydrogenase small subunit (CoxS/CutS family)
VIFVLNVTQCGLENSDNVCAVYSHNIPEDRRDIPEDMNLQHCRCENFAGYNVLMIT